MLKPHSISYWLVGGNAVAMDLHASNGDLVRPDGSDESAAFDLNDPQTAQEARGQAKNKALEYAAAHGVSPAFVFYDGDSTDFFANC